MQENLFLSGKQDRHDILYHSFLIHDGTNFILGSNVNNLQITQDFESFTPLHLPNDLALTRLRFSNGKILGASGRTVILIDSDYTTVHTAIAWTDALVTFNDITYDGSVYYAIGGRSQNSPFGATVTKSVDFITWTISLDNANVSNATLGLHQGKALNGFIIVSAVGFDNSARRRVVVLTPPGTTWAVGQVLRSTIDVTFFNGLYIFSEYQNPVDAVEAGIYTSTTPTSAATRRVTADARGIATSLTRVVVQLGSSYAESSDGLSYTIHNTALSTIPLNQNPSRNQTNFFFIGETLYEMNSPTAGEVEKRVYVRKSEDYAATWETLYFSNTGVALT